MKKISVLFLALLLCLALVACGKDNEETAEPESVSYISETEAEIFFYEITSTYRCELMQMSEEQLKAGVPGIYWEGLAEEVAELKFDELTDTYITEEERTLLSEAYGVNVANINFGVYSIAELQAGMDELFGTGRVDVSLWNNSNVDIVNTNIFGTSLGYFLYAKDESERYDTQIYEIISVTPGEGTAKVKAYGVSVDKITWKSAHDLAYLDDVTDEFGNTFQSYRLLEGAYIENFSYSDDFLTNMNNMAINTDYLGVMEFEFGINGISIYLDHINMP